MINKDVHKSLAIKNGNEILIWIWNNPGIIYTHPSNQCFLAPQTSGDVHHHYEEQKVPSVGNWVQPGLDDEIELM